MVHIWEDISQLAPKAPPKGRPAFGCQLLLGSQPPAGEVPASHVGPWAHRAEQAGRQQQPSGVRTGLRRLVWDWARFSRLTRCGAEHRRSVSPAESCWYAGPSGASRGVRGLSRRFPPLPSLRLCVCCDAAGDDILRGSGGCGPAGRASAWLLHWRRLLLGPTPAPCSGGAVQAPGPGRVGGGGWRRAERASASPQHGSPASARAASLCRRVQYFWWRFLLFLEEQLDLLNGCLFCTTLRVRKPVGCPAAASPQGESASRPPASPSCVSSGRPGREASAARLPRAADTNRGPGRELRSADMRPSTDRLGFLTVQWQRFRERA